jgi:hypothetical protein
MSPFNFFVHFLYVVTSSSGIVEELQEVLVIIFWMGGFFFCFFCRQYFVENDAVVTKDVCSSCPCHLRYLHGPLLFYKFFSINSCVWAIVVIEIYYTSLFNRQW